MNNKFSWTQEFRRSWDDETEQSEIKTFKPSLITSTNRKNVIRHLHIVIDTSAAIEKSDYLPSIRCKIVQPLVKFVKAFKESNPLSVLTFMTCRNVVEKFSKMFVPEKLLNSIGSNDFSLLNCLKATLDVLVNTKFNRECLIIISSTNTKDAGNYEDITKIIKKYNIKISIISLCGEVTLFSNICKLSNGLFFVPVDIYHFESILESFSSPLESLETTNVLVKMGFPEPTGRSGVCNCHLQFHHDLYECPQCKSFVCSLPGQCYICELQLVSGLDVIKTNYHIYPLTGMVDLVGEECRKCGRISSKRCVCCLSNYCEECHNFVAEYLKFCLYCD